MDMLLQDLRCALRRLRRNPAFAAVLVLALAVGIGANVALLRLLDAALLRTFPVGSRAGIVETALSEGGRLLAILRIRPDPAQPASPDGDRAGCVDIGVMGFHTSVSFHLARRSSEIGIRVGLGEGGGGRCA